MTTTYRTKLFRSVPDCGCNMGLGEFAEEAQVEDVRVWAAERGFLLARRDQAEVSEAPPYEVAHTR